MLLRTHLTIAVLFFLILFSQIQQKIIFFIFLISATYFPDIDIASSKIGKSIFLRPIQWIVSHRGLFHSLIFLSLLSALIYFFNNYAGIAFFSGYLLHLLLDALTPRGVKLFWPLTNLKIKFFIKSGSILEEIIFVICLLINLILIIRIIFR